MIRFSLLLTCSLLTSSFALEGTAFAMHQDDNDDAPQGIAPAPAPAPAPVLAQLHDAPEFWAAVANFYEIHPIQEQANQDKKRSE